MNDNSYEQYISSDSWVTVRLVSRPPTRDSVSQIRLLLVESFIACRTPGHVTLCVCVRVCVCAFIMLCFSEHPCMLALPSSLTVLQWRKWGLPIRPQITTVLTFIASTSLYLYCCKSQHDGSLWRWRSCDGNGRQGVYKDVQLNSFCCVDVIFHTCVLL